MRKNRKKIARKIARERINILYHLAEKRMREGEEDLARRYVDLMLKISRKYNVRLPKYMKYRVCKNCKTFLVPGKNARVRLKKRKVVITCLHCGNVKRYPYK